MKILDRYISKSIISIFLSGIFIFSFLYILIDMTSNLDEIIDRKIPWPMLLSYYSAFLPIIMVQTASMCCLIAVLLTYSHLNNNNEIVVLRTSGLSFLKIAKPALAIGLVVSALTFWLNEKAVPEATARSEKIRNESFVLKVDRERKRHSKIENLTFYGLKNRLYFIDSFDPNSYELEGITIIEYDNNQNILEKTVALKGTWTNISRWKFYQCHVSSFDSQQLTAPIKVKVYDEKLMDIQESPQDFLKQRLNVTSMNIQQLYDYITRFSQSGAVKALNNLRVDLHSKVAFPFGNFVIILVGLPLAMMTKTRKGVTFTSLGIAVLIGFLFYVFNAVGLALGKGGVMPPILAAWIAPLLFSGVAYYLIRTKF